MSTSLTLHEIVAAARGRRRELRLSQSDVAQRLGVSRTWVQAFERETGRASIQTVLRLMQVLGLSLDLAKSDAAGDGPDQIDLDELIQQHRQ
jgi:transcriptional regulator with XRE-family HTH domain